MTQATDALTMKRQQLHKQIEALAKKNQPQVASHRFVLALMIAGLVLFGGLAAAFYASAAQREQVLAQPVTHGAASVFSTVVEGAGHVQVNNLHQ